MDYARRVCIKHIHVRAAVGWELLAIPLGTRSLDLAVPLLVRANLHLVHIDDMHVHADVGVSSYTCLSTCVCILVLHSGVCITVEVVQVQILIFAGNQ